MYCFYYLGREKVVDLLIERGVQSRTDAKCMYLYFRVCCFSDKFSSHVFFLGSGINVANELGETALYAASTDLGDLESTWKNSFE